MICINKNDRSHIADAVAFGSLFGAEPPLGPALNLNIHFHMLFLERVYVERCDGSVRFRWVKAPTRAELTRLAHTIARRVGRFLERKGWLTRELEDGHLVGEGLEAWPMDRLLGSSITYRIAVGPQQGRKVFTLQSLPAGDSQEMLTDTARTRLRKRPEDPGRDGGEGGLFDAEGLTRQNFGVAAGHRVLDHS